MSDADWRVLVVAVECSLDAFSRNPSEEALRRRDLLLLAAETIGVEEEVANEGIHKSKKLVTKIRRKELEKRVGKSDPASLASALRHWLKKDRIKGIAKKTKQEEPAESKEKELGKEQSEEIASVLEDDNSLFLTPSVEDLKVVKHALCIPADELVPDQIYFLVDFPASAEEAHSLLPIDSNEQILDAVLELKGPTHGSSYSHTTLKAEPNRKSMIEFENSKEPAASTTSLPVQKDLWETSAYGMKDTSSFVSSSASFATTRSTVRDSMQLDVCKVSSKLIREIFKCQEEAKGPGWRDLILLEMAVCPRENKDADTDEAFKPATLLRSMMDLCLSTAIEKQRFQRYLSGCPKVRIQPFEPALINENPSLQYYNSQKIDTRAILSSSGLVAAVLTLMVDAIERPERPTQSVEDQLWANLSVPGGRRRQRMPSKAPRTEDNRRRENSQFGSFLGMDPARLFHIRSTRALEQLINDRDPPLFQKWDFSKRIKKRVFHGAELCRNLGQELATNTKHIYSQYLALSDSLVLVLHSPVPEGRQSKKTNSIFAATSLRPVFSDWSLQDLRFRPCFFEGVDFAKLRKLATETEWLYPSDNGLIGIHKTHQRSWCTVLKDAQSFGLRQDGFLCSFSDGSTLVSSRGPKTKGKPDNQATVRFSYTLRDGLNVTHCSNGMITMKSSSSVGEEQKRIVFGDGTVLSLLRNGSKKLFYANGLVGWKLAESSEWKYASPYDLSKLDQIEACIDPIDKSLTLRRVIPELGTEVFVVFHANDTRLVIHPDGTHALLHEDSDILRIESPGLASVKIRMKAEATAALHSSGGRVDISRGENAIRSSTLFPDATVVHVEYDTRVTAAINGSMHLIKADGTRIEASDDGLVKFRPWNIDHLQRHARENTILEEEEAKVHPDARESFDRDLGCYVFNLDDCSLVTVDWDRNVFKVESATKRNLVKTTVSLAGSFGPVQAIINSIPEPRIFVMDGNGSGYELLDSDALQREYARLEKEYRAKLLDRGSRFHRIDLQETSVAPQLKQAQKYVPETVKQKQAFSNLPAERFRKERTRRVFSDEWELLEEIEPEERKQVEDAEQTFKQWRQELAGKENQFKVEDSRPKIVQEEEKKMQILLKRERRNLRRAERRKQMKLAKASALAQSSPPAPPQKNSEIGKHQLPHIDTSETFIEESILQSEKEGHHVLESFRDERTERPEKPRARNKPQSAGINFWQAIKSPSPLAHNT